MANRFMYKTKTYSIIYLWKFPQIFSSFVPGPEILTWLLKVGFLPVLDSSYFWLHILSAQTLNKEISCKQV